MAIEQPANPLYKDKEVLDFELILDNNFYTNLKSLRICFPLHIKKLSNSAANLHGDIYLVNNFLAHWVKEIDILKYGTNKSLIPRKSIYTLTRCLNICQKKRVRMLQNDLFYNKKLGIIAGGNDRRIHNNDNEPFRTDDNLENCEDKFEVQIDSKYVYSSISVHIRVHIFAILEKLIFRQK